MLRLDLMWGFTFNWLIFMTAWYILYRSFNTGGQIYVLTSALCTSLYWLSWPQHQCKKCCMSSDRNEQEVSQDLWKHASFLMYSMLFYTNWKTVRVQCCWPCVWAVSAALIFVSKVQRIDVMTTCVVFFGRWQFPRHLLYRHSDPG